MAGGPNNNIFLTTENLAFAFPLILVCSIYVYFKFVPLNIALSVLAVLFLLFQARSALKSNREKKLETLDDDVVKDLLLGEEDELQNSQRNQQQAEKQRKAKARVEMRLAAERKQQNKQQQKKTKGKIVEKEDEPDALLTFAKGSRETKKKN